MDNLNFAETQSCTGENWEFSYEINGVTGTSTVFRVENVEGNCATFRVFIPTTTTYTLSNSYFTIDLSCVLAMLSRYLCSLKRPKRSFIFEFINYYFA